MEITEKNGYKNINFGDIAPNTSVVVEKRYADAFEREGKYGPFYSTNVGYEGEECGVIVNAKVYPEWKSLPIGPVKVTNNPEQISFKNKEGGTTKKWVSRISFETMAEEDGSSAVLSDRQLAVLKHYVAQGKDRNMMVSWQVSDTETSQKRVTEILPEIALDQPNMFI